MKSIIQKRCMLQIVSLFLCTFLFISCSEDSSVDEEIGIENNEDVNAKHHLSNHYTHPSWADSFAYNGKCYCKSTYDHHIGGIKVNGRTVRSICEKMKGAMWNALNDAKKKGKKVTWYNTVRCGHWPWHNDRTIEGQKDEVICPGQVGWGIKCNKRKGPAWH